MLYIFLCTPLCFKIQTWIYTTWWWFHINVRLSCVMVFEMNIFKDFSLFCVFKNRPPVVATPFFGRSWFVQTYITFVTLTTDASTPISQKAFFISSLSYPWGKAWLFISINLNPLYLGVLCVGWILLSNSEKKSKMRILYRRTDNRQKLTYGHLIFSSSEKQNCWDDVNNEFETVDIPGILMDWKKNWHYSCREF